MGTRYIVSVKCPDCGAQEEAYYAPTCDFVRHICACGNVVDLEKYTGITYEDASNLAEIERLIQNQYMPDHVSPPGATLLEVLDMFEVTRAELAELTGESIEMIDGIIEGIVPITAEMALQLACAVSVPARFWINREQSYRRYLERKADEWSETWPIEPGHYWFYMWRSVARRRKPEMILVKVRKTRNSIAYVGNGRFIYKAEGAHGLWKKAVLPEPPDLPEER